ncbi:hypothetical protein M5689_002753 [Euphorbia peplus]|nr:hypothetical protein M5689_002753 [Euphorbia peplus]
MKTRSSELVLDTVGAGVKTLDTKSRFSELVLDTVGVGVRTSEMKAKSSELVPSEPGEGSPEMKARSLVRGVKQ